MGIFRTWNRVLRSGGVAFEWQTPTDADGFDSWSRKVSIRM